MSLHVKNIFIVVVALVCIVCVPYMVLCKMLDDSHARMERTAVKFCVTLAGNALADEGRVLDAFVRDWAFWDDTYQFVQDGNQDYMESNLSAGTFSEQNLDVMAFYSNSGELVFGRRYDSESDSLLALPRFFEEYWRNHAFPLGVDDCIGGIILLPEGPMMLAARPVLTSENEGPVPGVLIVGRFLNNAFAARISDKLGVPFDIRRIHGDNITPEFHQALMYLNETNSDEFFVQEIDTNQSAGYALISDTDGEPVLIMQVRLPKSYFAFDVDMSNFVAIFVITGVVFGVGLIFMMEKFVLSRVGHLSRAASEIAKSRDMTARISLKGNDELTNLADEINVMLQSLEKSEQLLAAKEQAERAAAVLAKEKKFSENLIETINSFVLGMDTEGRIKIFNHYAERFTGYRREELMGKSLFSTLAVAREMSWLRNAIQEASQMEELPPGFASFEATVQCKNGQEALFRWENSILQDENGKRMGTLSVGVDITEQRRAETLIRRAREQSEALSRELEQKVDELERFNKMAVGREQKIIELKKEVNQICEKHNEPKMYDVGFAR